MDLEREQPRPQSRRWCGPSSIRTCIRTRTWRSVRAAEVHTRKKGVRSIEKFHADVSADIAQHRVVAHPERILTVVAAGIPGIDSSHRAGIRSDERRERKDTVAIVPPARRQGRNHRMGQPRKESLALTAEVPRVFPEDLCQPVTRGSADRLDGEI